MTELLRRKLCDIVAAHGPGVADDPRRCAELLRQAVPEDGAGVQALLRALDAHVPARLALLTEPLALAPLTSGLVRRLVEEQGLSEEAARWAVESWAVALGKEANGPPAAGQPAAYEHLLAPPRRRRRWLWYALPVLALLAGLGAWKWLSLGAEVRRISARAGGMYCLALSPDGHTVIVGCGDHSVRLWDVDSGAELRRLEGHQVGPFDVALAPDGRLALSGSGWQQMQDGKSNPIDCTLRAWDLTAGQQREPPWGKYDVPVFAVGFSPDGRLAIAATGGYQPRDPKAPAPTKEDKPVPLDCLVRLYDAATGQELRQLAGHKLPVKHAAFLPGGKRVVSAADDGTVRLWDVATGQELRQAELDNKARVFCLAVSPDGHRLLTADDQSRVWLWDLDDLSPLLEQKRSDLVRCLAFSGDGRRALLGGNDYIVRLWDVETLTEVRHYTGHSGAVMGVAFLPDGRHALSGSDDGTIRIWRLP
jgi:WD40 repeat protein